MAAASLKTEMTPSNHVFPDRVEVYSKCSHEAIHVFSWPVLIFVDLEPFGKSLFFYIERVHACARVCVYVCR